MPQGESFFPKAPRGWCRKEAGPGLGSEKPCAWDSLCKKLPHPPLLGRELFPRVGTWEALHYSVPPPDPRWRCS